MTPRIALDIDGVICDYLGSYLKHVNHKLGTNIRKDNVLQWDFHLDHGVDEAEMRSIADEFIERGGMANLEPIRDAVKHVNHLVEYYPVVFITHRPEEARADTMQWFEQHIPAALRCPIEFTQTKGIAAQAFETTHFLDDKLENVMEVWAANVPNVCLFSGPYNQVDQIYKFPRANTWEDVFRIWRIHA